MPSADEYRAQVVASREALRNAIAGVGGRWEASPGGDGEASWAPRKVAEHVLGAERMFAGMVARAMEGKSPERKEYSFPDPATALAALDETCADCDRVLRYVEDRDLAKAAPMPDALPFPKTIEGVFQLSTYHLADHANQIASS
jgi:hypothetical protein